MRYPFIHFREERDLGQKINATFGFIRQNFKPLLKSMLYIVAPWALIGGIFGGISQYRMLRVDSNFSNYGSWGALNFGRQITSAHYLIAMFFLLVSFVLVALTISAYVVEYMDNKGRVDFSMVRDRVKSNFLTVLYSTFGTILLCLLGFAVLVVPGIYLSVAYSMFIIVMVREELGFVETLERCYDLIKGYWWRTLGLLFVIGIIQTVIAFITTLPATVVQMMTVAQVPGFDSQILVIVSNSFSTIANILFYAITVIALAFQYFNLVEKKEGIGYLELADQIGLEPVVSETEEDEY